MGSKYPIILVHGIALKDYKFFRAFGRIEDILKSQGHIVYTSTTDGFGTIENNALQLKEQILEVLEKHNVDKVNLIAHSKGGLDSVYMIEQLGMADRIASLTTLSTPYKGSPIATFLLKLPKFLIKIISFWVNLIYKIFKDKKPDSYKTCIQLKEVEDTSIKALNVENDIYVQSYSSTMKKSRDDFVMGIPLLYFKYKKAGESDGMVSKESSKFGEYKGDMLEESISHAEMVDFTFNKEKKEKVYAFYLKIVNELVEKGF